MIQEPRKLSIYEAHVITDKQPALNRQVDYFINPLPLFARRNHNRQSSVAVHTRNYASVDGNLCNAPCRYPCVEEDENSYFSVCTGSPYLWQRIFYQVSQ